MNPNLKKYAQLAKIKLQDFYPDEHKEHGWTNVTCTDKELNRFLELVINDIIHETQQGKILTTYNNFIGDK